METITLATDPKYGPSNSRPNSVVPYQKMNLSTIKAVAIDVDGTLLDSDHRLRDEVKDALCDLDSKEIKIVLATARGPSVLGEVLHRLPLSPLLICFSGGWVGEIDGRSLVPKRTVLDRRHPMSAARSIVSLALELNIEPNVFTLEKWRVRKMTQEILLESQITRCSPLITSDLLEDGNEPGKILLITGENESPEGLHVIAEAIRSVSNPAFSKSNYLEIVPFGVNKAEALLHLTALLGLKLSEVAAIGDGHNDIEMLSECGLGIAMGNASEPVKSVAQWVTGTNDEAGVAQAIRRLSAEGLV